MRKLVIAGAILLAIIFIGLICNLTGMLRMYSIPTVSNQPAIIPGSYVFSTNLKDTEAGNFIAYNNNGQPWIHRLIATEGDIILIKDGTVYINNKDFDKDLKLLHGYILSRENTAKIATSLPAGQNPMPGPDGAYYLFLEDAVASRNGLAEFRAIAGQKESDKYISEIFGQPWNKDFFGPYTVPVGKLFVMGDNRDNSQDSRYIGCIDKSDVIGTVLK